MKKIILVAALALMASLAAGLSFDSALNDSNSEIDLVYNPTDTIQKNVDGDLENTYLMEVNDYSISESGNRHSISVELQLTELGKKLSGAPDEINYNSLANELDGDGYVINGSSPTVEELESLRDDLENLEIRAENAEGFSVDKVPRGLAINPKNVFTAEVSLKDPGTSNPLIGSFKIGSNSIDFILAQTLSGTSGRADNALKFLNGSGLVYGDINSGNYYIYDSSFQLEHSGSISGATRIRDAAYNDDQNYIALATEGAGVVVINRNDYSVEHQITQTDFGQTISDAIQLTYSPDKNHLIYVDTNGIFVLDTQTYTNQDGYGDGGVGGTMDVGDNYVYLSSFDTGELARYSYDPMGSKTVLENNWYSGIDLYNSNNDLIAVDNTDNIISNYDLSTLTQDYSKTYPFSVGEDIDVLPESNDYITGSSTGNIIIGDATTGNNNQNISGYDTSLSIDSYNQYLALSTDSSAYVLENQDFGNPPIINSFTLSSNQIQEQQDFSLSFDIDDSNNKGISDVQVDLVDPNNNIVASVSKSYSAVNVTDTFSREDFESSYGSSELFDNGGDYKFNLTATNTNDLTAEESRTMNVIKTIEIKDYRYFEFEIAINETGGSSNQRPNVDSFEATFSKLEGSVSRFMERFFILIFYLMILIYIFYYGAMKA